MRAERTGPPRGRQREADLNDERLLKAARQVFAELGWDAPVSAIARRAGVGMGSLYRRYERKEDLVREIQLAGMARLTALAEEAAGASDPWEGFATLLRKALRPGDETGILWAVGGRLEASPEIEEATRKLESALGEVVDRAQRAGVLRADVTAADIPVLLEHLNTRLPGDPARAGQLHLRYAELILTALRGPATEPLPQPAPDWSELRELWNRKRDDGA